MANHQIQVYQDIIIRSHHKIDHQINWLSKKYYPHKLGSVHLLANYTIKVYQDIIRNHHKIDHQINWLSKNITHIESGFTGYKNQQLKNNIKMQTKFKGLFIKRLKRED